MTSCLQGLPKAPEFSQVGETGRCFGNTPSVGAQQRVGQQVKGRLQCHYMCLSFVASVSHHVSSCCPCPVVWMWVWPCSCWTATTRMLRFARWPSGSWRLWKMTMCSDTFCSSCRCVFFAIFDFLIFFYDDEMLLPVTLLFRDALTAPLVAPGLHDRRKISNCDYFD